MKKKNSKILRTLFLSTLYLSTFTFGGGYVIVSLMKKDFVDARHWIDEEEMLDLVAIAQSAPGAIAVNGAIVVGYKLAGILGAFVAIFGTVIPPFVIISILSVCYQASVQPAGWSGMPGCTDAGRYAGGCRSCDCFCYFWNGMFGYKGERCDIRACSDSFISSCMQREN